MSIALTRTRRLMREARAARSGHQPVERVPLAGDVAGLVYEALDLRAGGAAVGPGGAHDVLLDHRAAHVVRAEFQRDLADLLALRDPGRLDVGNVVHEQAGDRLRAQVFRAGDLAPAQGGVLRLVGPGDERG